MAIDRPIIIRGGSTFVETRGRSLLRGPRPLGGGKFEYDHTDLLLGPIPADMIVVEIVALNLISQDITQISTDPETGWPGLRIRIPQAGNFQVRVLVRDPRYDSLLQELDLEADKIREEEAGTQTEQS